MNARDEHRKRMRQLFCQRCDAELDGGEFAAQGWCRACYESICEQVEDRRNEDPQPREPRGKQL